MKNKTLILFSIATVLTYLYGVTLSPTKVSVEEFKDFVAKFSLLGGITAIVIFRHFYIGKIKSLFLPWKILIQIIVFVMIIAFSAIFISLASPYTWQLRNWIQKVSDDFDSQNFEEASKSSKELLKIYDEPMIWLMAAQSFRMNNENKLAKDYYLKSLDYHQSQNNFEPETVSICLLWLGEIYLNQGEFGKAEENLINAIEISTDVFGSESEQRASGFRMLSEVYFEQGKFEEAEANIKKAIDINYNILNDVDSEIIECNLIYIKILMNIKKFLLAKQVSLETHQKIKSLSEMNVYHLISNLVYLGSLNFALNQYDEAVSYYKEGLDLALKEKNKETNNTDYKIFSSYQNHLTKHLHDLVTETRSHDEAVEILEAIYTKNNLEYRGFHRN